MLQIKVVGRELHFITPNTTFRIWSSSGNVDVNAIKGYIQEQQVSKEEMTAWVESREKDSTSDVVFMRSVLKEQDLTTDFFPDEIEEFEEIEEVPVQQPVRQIIRKKVGAK